MIRTYVHMGEEGQWERVMGGGEESERGKEGEGGEKMNEKVMNRKK